MSQRHGSSGGGRLSHVLSTGFRRACECRHDVSQIGELVRFVGDDCPIVADDDCPICKGPLCEPGPDEWKYGGAEGNSRWLELVQPCGHLFHAGCFAKVVMPSNGRIQRCPLCRAAIRDDELIRIRSDNPESARLGFPDIPSESPRQILLSTRP